MTRISPEVARTIRAQELDRERQDRIREQAVERFMANSTLQESDLSAELKASRSEAKKWKHLLMASSISNFVIAAIAAHQILTSC